jgi:uncharacterized membrane protein YfcA
LFYVGVFVFEFLIAIVVVGFFAGMTASVAGFGIGSFLIPLVNVQTGTKVAIALVSLPHFLGSASRFWLLKSKVNRKILVRFGLLSAAGGLAGAFLHIFFVSNLLQVIFAVMLILAGILGLLQVSDRLRFGKKSAAVVGLVSGFFGGLVGEQGGIRSVALLNFEVEKEALVATATATALIVDAVRMPIYFLSQSGQVNQFLLVLIVSSATVIAGTFVGNSLLNKIPENLFKRIVSFLILLLGNILLIIALL